MFSNNRNNSNNRNTMYHSSSDSYHSFHSNKRRSNVNPFNKERHDNNSTERNRSLEQRNNSRFPRPYTGTSEKQNQNRRNYSYSQNRPRFYSSYQNKEVNKAPTFNLIDDNFPSLSSGSSTQLSKTFNVNNKNNLNFSKMLKSNPITKDQTHPQPKKKFVSLVNLSKRTKHTEEEEFETDEEVQEMIDEHYNSMDEELEEYYNEERAKEDYFDYDY